MRLTFKAETQSGSLGSGAATCLSEAVTAQNPEVPGMGILFLRFQLAPQNHQAVTSSDALSSAKRKEQREASRKGVEGKA